MVLGIVLVAAVEAEGWGNENTALADVIGLVIQKWCWFGFGFEHPLSCLLLNALLSPIQDMIDILISQGNVGPFIDKAGKGLGLENAVEKFTIGG